MGIPQIRVCDFVQTVREIEARRELVCECLIVDKAICARRSDRLLVHAHGVEMTAFNACDFCAHECGAVFEILRTMLCPYFKLPVMSHHSVKVVSLLIR